MLRHLLICTLALSSWQPATLSSEILQKNQSDTNSIYDVFKNYFSSRPNSHDSDEYFEYPVDVPSKFNRRPYYYDCGVSSQSVPLIVFGRPAVYGEWPWHVMTNYIEDGYLRGNCGGSLVTLNKVITAGHCVVNINTKKRIFPKNYIVVAGSFHTNWHNSKDFGMQAMGVSRIALHPGFKFDKYGDDIAVLTLSEDVEITRYVRPACLWNLSETFDDIADEVGTVVGNGVNERNLMSQYSKVARVRYATRERCLLTDAILPFRLHNTKTFCTVPVTNNNICIEDGGSGLYYRIGYKWYLRGIASGVRYPSSTASRCENVDCAVFTDVAQYRQFIDAHLAL